MSERRERRRRGWIHSFKFKHSSFREKVKESRHHTFFSNEKKRKKSEGETNLNPKYFLSLSLSLLILNVTSDMKKVKRKRKLRGRFLMQVLHSIREKKEDGKREPSLSLSPLFFTTDPNISLSFSLSILHSFPPFLNV